MSNYFNGVDEPKFIIRNGNITVTEITLSITNRAGLVETYNDFTIKKRLHSGKLKSIKKLKSITFTLNYDEYFIKSDGAKIEKILNYETEGKKIILVPRIDIPERFYEVEYTGEAFSIGVLPGGYKSPGHRLPVLSWETVDLTKFKTVDPDADRYIVALYEAILPAA